MERAFHGGQPLVPREMGSLGKGCGDIAKYIDSVSKVYQVLRPLLPPCPRAAMRITTAFRFLLRMTPEAASPSQQMLSAVMMSLSVSSRISTSSK
jgi:hypothetical protein